MTRYISRLIEDKSIENIDTYTQCVWESPNQKICICMYSSFCTGNGCWVQQDIKHTFRILRRNQPDLSEPEENVPSQDSELLSFYCESVPSVWI